MIDKETAHGTSSAGFSGVDVDGLIERELDDVIAMRRDLHRFPETGLALPRTQALVQNKLLELGLEFVSGKTIGSIVAISRGAADGPTLLLRADMDALPIQEETRLEFASTVPNVMHACGHDLHTAALLGVAAVLKQIGDELAGNVILMFQPGEEGHFGAKKMIDEGLLDTSSFGISPPTRAFALHVNPWYPLGEIHLRSGPILASADSFRILFHGVSGHGSAPHAAIDPIPAMCELVLAVQSYVARRVSAFVPTVVSVTSVSAGSEVARSVIPGTAGIAGTIRTLSGQSRTELLSGLRRISEGIASAHELSAEISFEPGYPVTQNDPHATAAIIDDLRKRLTGDSVHVLETPLMGSEDFSYVLEEVPGALGFVGTTPSELLSAGYPPDNHSAEVHYDEGALRAFMAAHLAVVEGYLARR